MKFCNVTVDVAGLTLPHIQNIIKRGLTDFIQETNRTPIIVIDNVEEALVADTRLFSPDVKTFIHWLHKLCELQLVRVKYVTNNRRTIEQIEEGKSLCE